VLLQENQYYSGANNTSIIATATTLDAWHELTGTVTVNSLTTGMQIRLSIATTASAGEYFYADDISVQRPIYASTIGSVSETLSQYDQIPDKDLPALMVIDADERRRWESMAASSTQDMRGELSIVVSCVVFDKDNSTRSARLALMKDVEMCLMNDATLGALILDIAPTDIVTDKGTVPNYSIWDQSFMIRYFYNSANGG
jgi:hypothetical protein